MKMASKSIDLFSKKNKNKNKFARARISNKNLHVHAFLSFFAVVLNDHNAVLYD